MAKTTSKAKTAANSIVYGVSAALALVLLNALTCQSRAKIDLTENDIYTLSEASARMVRTLPEKMLVKAYFGNIPPEHRLKQEYVESILAEYASASGGKLEYQKIDPWENPELQEELRKEGIQRIWLLSMKEDKQEQIPAYFAVQFIYLDKKELWLPGQRFELAGLEYEFSTRIKRLALGKKKIGVTVGFGEPEQIQALQHPQLGLAYLYDVVPVNWRENPKTLDEVDAVVVNGPTDRVSDAAKWHLDQALMKGKPVVFLVRGVRWQPGNQQMAMLGEDAPYLGTPADHGLGDLLAHYGFEVASDTVIDKRYHVMGAIPMGRQPLLRGEFFPLTEVLAGGPHEVLEGMQFVPMPFVSTVKLVGPLAAEKPAGFEVKPLLRTSPTSFARKDVIVITRDTKIQMNKEERGPYVVAYAVQGKWKSFFDGKPAPAGVDAASPVKESPPSARMVVFGGSEFAEDKMVEIMRYVGTDAFLNGYRALHNAVDWALMDMDLVAVRSKQVERPLEPLESKDRILVKYANVAGTPLALILFGIVYWRVRERRRRHITL